MICYMDMSFCASSEECAADCFRRLTKEGRERAEKRGLPVAYIEYRDTESCPGFEAAESEEDRERS